MVQVRNFVAACAVAVTAIASVEAKVWVSDLIGTPTDTACYRKAYRSKECPANYDPSAGFCWAQCPIEYPVECGLQCVEQKTGCAKNVMGKVAKVATAAMNAATLGVFGPVVQTSKKVVYAVKCGQALIPFVTDIVEFVRDEGKASTTRQEIEEAMKLEKIALEKLPDVVAECLGVDYKKEAAKVDKVIDLFYDNFIKVMDDPNADILNPETFLEFVTAIGLGPSKAEIAAAATQRRLWSFSDLWSDANDCGAGIMKPVNKIVENIKKLMKAEKTTTTEAIRMAVMASDVFLKDIPDAVVACLDAEKPEYFEMRDKILSTVHVVVDRIIDATSTNQGEANESHFVATVADIGLDLLENFDATGFASMAKEFVQPICGPTIFTKPIDDGKASEALGLSTVDEAFAGTDGKWESKGDGKVTIAFKSTDEKPVTVNIKSGGNEKDIVELEAGGTGAWEGTMADLGGKTLFMDRSKKGLVFWGTGGGSVAMWVPENAKGGLALEVTISPAKDGKPATRYLEAYNGTQWNVTRAD